MKNGCTYFYALAVISLIILTGGCTSDTPTQTQDEQPPKVTPSVPAKGDRLLGLGLTEGAVGFGESFELAQGLGVQVVELPLAWDDIETAPREYHNEYLDIANVFYPPNNMQISLSINPIDTNNLRLPSDLIGKDLDDPEVIERYNKLIDYVFSRTPDVDLVSVSIGNEIDGYLGNDQDKWDQYNRFFKETSAHARSKRPGVNVGTKIMFEGIMGNNARAINQHSDIVLVTYYPLNADFRVQDPAVVHRDLDEITSVYSNRTIYFAEAGYPSSSYLGSSEEKQSQFITEMFSAWDDHSAQVAFINLIWLHDISGSEVNRYTGYYSLSSRGFSEYLGTLGLRTYDGEDKQAFATLQREAAARGW